VTTHTCKKNYKCEVSDKAFSAQSNLISQMAIHTSEKKHKCEICDKAFTTQDILICQCTMVRKIISVHPVVKHFLNGVILPDI
jgi:hypothetical protein